MKLVPLYYHENFESIKLLGASITNEATQPVDTKLIEDKNASQPGRWIHQYPTNIDPF